MPNNLALGIWIDHAVFLAFDVVVFTAFDPSRRKGKLAEADVKDIDFWDLSPDGRWIAYGKSERTDGRIRLLSFAGEALREMAVGG